MHISLLSLVMSAAVLTASAAALCHCWRAARHRRAEYGRRDAQRARLTAALRDVGKEPDRVAATAAQDGRYR